MHTRLIDACKWLAQELSCRPEELYAAHPGAGDMLLMGLESHNLILRERGRIGLTQHGRRLAADKRPVAQVEG